MIRVARDAVIDGVTYQIAVEVSKPTDALSALESILEELGAAPGPAPAAANGARRPRRSKEEMAAARAAISGAPAQTVDPAVPPVVTSVSLPATGATSDGSPAYSSTPSVLPGPMPPAEPLRAFGPPADQVPAATGDVTWSDAPPVPQDGKTVAFDGPAPPLPDVAPVAPPPPKTVEETLREQIDASLKATIDLNPPWHDGIMQAYHKIIGPQGGDIFQMNEAQLRLSLQGVESYKERVRVASGR
jgi:hypothetical protein